jgi:alpha-mannosidase
MAEQATPRPWHTLKGRRLYNIKGPEGEQICQVRDAEHADLILRAVNMHDELVEALRCIRREARSRNVVDNLEARLNRIVKMARAALAKAEARQ